MTNTTAAIRFIIRLGRTSARGWFWSGLVLACLGPATLVVLPFVAGEFVDSINAGDRSALWALAAVLGIAGALTWALTVLEASVSNGITTRVEIGFVMAVAKSVSGPVTVEHFEQEHRARLAREIQEGRFAIIQAPWILISLIRVAMRALVIFTFLAILDVRLLVLPVAASVPFLVDSWTARRQGEHESNRSDSLAEAMEVFSVSTSPRAAAEIRVFGMGSRLIDIHAARTKELVAFERRTALTNFGSAVLGWLVVTATLVIVIRWLVLSAGAGEISPGSVVAAVLLAQAAGFVLSIGAPLLTRFRLSLKQVHKMVELGEPSEAHSVVDLGPTLAIDGIGAGLQLERLSFAYPGQDRDALSEVSLTIPAGSSVALVGSNGAGKSTLVKLLLGLYVPTGGQLLCDGVPLSEHRLAEWQRRTTAMFQDFVRYELSAGLNVGIGSVNEMSDESIHQALAKVDGEVLLADLSDGLETDLSGLSGSGLSGGQWQRLAAGRTMMPQSPWLAVFDEPTSALDVDSEDQLLSMYASVAREAAERSGMISVFVTHRMGMTREADTIVVLDEGRVLEVGSHSELLAADGRYARLYKMQAQSYS